MLFLGASSAGGFAHAWGPQICECSNRLQRFGRCQPKLCDSSQFSSMVNVSPCCVFPGGPPLPVPRASTAGLYGGLEQNNEYVITKMNPKVLLCNDLLTNLHNSGQCKKSDAHFPKHYAMTFVMIYLWVWTFQTSARFFYVFVGGLIQHPRFPKFHWGLGLCAFGFCSVWNCEHWAIHSSRVAMQNTSARMYPWFATFLVSPTQQHQLIHPYTCINTQTCVQWCTCQAAKSIANITV